MSREAYVSVTVGFAAATTPGVVTGGTTTAAPEDGAPEGMFAALLAMIAPPAEIEAAPETVTSSEFGSLIEALKVAATSTPDKVAGKVDEKDLAEPDETSQTSEATTTLGDPESAQGKSLLKDLGDALVAINDATEAGKPVDPALEDKLDEALQALAAMLGIALPTTPTVDPRISALATGEGMLPTVDAPAHAAPTPTTPAVPAEAEAAPAGSAIDTPDAAAPADFVDALLDATGLDATDPVETAPAPAASSEATTLEEAPQALRDLGLLIGKLAERLEPKDPVLAKKLAALSEGLQSGTVSDDLLATLGIDDADTDPDLKRIIDALGAPKTAATKPAEAQPFIAPTLTLPDVAPSKKDAAAADSAATAPAPAKLESAPIDVAKPSPTTTSAATADRDTATADKPAPQAAAPTAADSTTQANTTPQVQQPAAAQAARTIHAAYQAPVQQLNLPQVAFEVVRQFDAGNSRFQIRLDPSELGRIDVRLDVDKSGTINARMTVERPETLDLMQRDQRALQQALQQAGLDASRTNLEFSLRQNPFAAQGGMGDGRGQQSGFGTGGTLGGEEAASETATTIYRGTATAGGVNLFV